MIDIREGVLGEELKREIFDGFARHAVEMTGFNEKNDPVAFIAREGKDFAGSVVVEKFWGALHVKYLYVDEKYRGKGLARELMERAFQFGMENECAFAFVETMSFQAVDFYRKMGFKLEFSRLGYAHKTSFHYLRKDFL